MTDRLGPGPLPRHIAIIMDGNGRWAKARGRPRFEGHAYGAKSVREIVTAARENDIKALTLYAFSVQNWDRPDEEVEKLMELLLDYLVEERATILDNGIRLQGIGQIDRLPPYVKKQLDFLSDASKHNDDMVLSLALSYGGREEIVRAVRQVVADGLAADDVDAATIDERLYTNGLPELDLIIRTSGEMRLSNFLLWQCAYAEIVVTDVLWPDFHVPEFFECIEAYRGRRRRYGKTQEQIDGDA